MLESFGALTLEDKKVEISEEEKLIKTKGDKGQGENLVKAKWESPKGVKQKAKPKK